MAKGKKYQGQSESTEQKKRGLESIFTQQLMVVSASPRLRYQRYVHIDLNSGSGWNSKVDVIGSPTLFSQVAARHQYKNYLMLCVDHCKESVATLARDYLRHDKNAFPFYGDNGEFCECVPDLLLAHDIQPRTAIGTVLVDPNGFKEQIPWDGLRQLFELCPRLDCLFNFPGNAYTRNSMSQEWVHIDEVPERLNKSHWHVREPTPTWKFTMCIGRNTNKISLPGNGFVAWESKRGKAFRDKCMMSSEEFGRRPMAGQQVFGFAK